MEWMVLATTWWRWPVAPPLTCPCWRCMNAAPVTLAYAPQWGGLFLLATWSTPPRSVWESSATSPKVSQSRSVCVCFCVDVWKLEKKQWCGMKSEGIKRTRAVGNFFGYSCVPGVKDPQHDPRGNNPKNLCEACIGDENDRHICANNHRERHYGEAGALRCVAENLGDVAFVKHTTIFDNLDGKNQESWALDLEVEDLKLLCPDGTEAGLDEYDRCHLAAVPTNAVVVRTENKCRVWKYLERVQSVFGNATGGFRLFSSTGYGASDLLFSDATHHLQRVLGSYTSWLGPSYTTMLQAFECEGFC
uniref:otolith matrix protein 1 isoform X2 n=1 Tax=Scatophagus argus TaxID=75038 RepID=UPI001ED7EBDA|nr:otolith matrix protein 1 isoform X2 [Scatophagus argus]